MSDTIELKHAQLAELGRGVGALRLALGDGLGRLGVGFQKLGFPTLESYSREALQRSGRWASETRMVARRLTALPALREALVCGHLTWSMAELLVRVATAEDEAEWVARVAELDVRGLRALLKMRQVGSGDEREPRVTIAMRVDRVDAWAFEHARLMVEAVGAARGDEAIEALLAEGLGALLAREADLDLPRGIGGDGVGLRTSDEVVGRVARVDAVVVAGGEVEVIDAELRVIARELGKRDVELGRLARVIEDGAAWRGRGFASFDDYCREHIGLSPSSVVTRMVLARRLEWVPAIGEALERGRIGYEAAALVARVATVATAHDWIERAEDRTVKHLREEVDAVEMMARANGHEVARYGPPSVAALAEVQAIELQVIATVTGQDVVGQMSGDETQASGQMSGEVTLRFSVGESVGQFWRALERLHGQMSDQMSAESFVAFLVRATIASWRGSQPAEVAYGDVYLRDRWRCASPVCTSRNVTPHHILFRAHGGGEERANLVSLCERCHLELVHGNALRVRGDACERMTWEARGWRVDGRGARSRAVHGDGLTVTVDGC